MAYVYKSGDKDAIEREITIKIKLTTQRWVIRGQPVHAGPVCFDLSSRRNYNR